MESSLPSSPTSLTGTFSFWPRSSWLIFKLRILFISDSEFDRYSFRRSTDTVLHATYPRPTFLSSKISQTLLIRNINRPVFSADVDSEIVGIDVSNLRQAIDTEDIDR